MTENDLLPSVEWAEGSLLQQSAYAIASGEWENAHVMMPFNTLHPKTQNILLITAHKGICAGMIMAGL